MSFRSTARSLGLGRAAYWLWHWPRAEIARSRREGGPVSQWITRRGRMAMEAAAANLPIVPIPARHGEEPTLVGMTGGALWYQTAFCLYSLFRQTEVRPPVRLLDDGTLTPAQAIRLQTLFPGVSIESLAKSAAATESRLPTAMFSRLRTHEHRFVLLRKLTHVHGGGRGWQLFLDADMLFHHRPRQLEAWLAAPDQPIFMTDIQNAYGYSLDVLGRLAGQRVPERINTGVSGLHAGTFDWPRIETWLGEILDHHRSSYYLEQALFALHLAGRRFIQLPATDYIVAPDPLEIQAPRAVLHHYVATTKIGYFRHAWRVASQRLKD